MATASSAYFEQISAVESGVRVIRHNVSEAEKRRLRGVRTVLLIDEIHRFSKSQQDVLLPYVEEGLFTLIGATTENPSFEVIAPLLSRARVYTLTPLSDEDVRAVIDRALKDKERGLGNEMITLENGGMMELVNLANGDARMALDSLELAANVSEAQAGEIVIDATTVAAAVQRKARYDRVGDAHYDTISAFIKCVRSSDPDAALYYLARMLDAGEDPMFIARRLVILAAEDIGLANPNALILASAVQQSVHLIGIPEARIPLAEATIYLASSAKSNSAYKAIDSALKYVAANRDEPIPMHLRNAPTKLMKGLGYGKDYKYAHNYPEHFVKMNNLPEKAQGTRFYAPDESNAVEERIAERLKGWWGRGRST